MSVLYRPGAAHRCAPPMRAVRVQVPDGPGVKETGPRYAEVGQQPAEHDGSVWRCDTCGAYWTAETFHPVRSHGYSPAYRRWRPSTWGERRRARRAAREGTACPVCRDSGRVAPP